MKIVIQSVDKDFIRNDQLDDYYYDEDGTFNIAVANVGTSFHKKLVAIHALIEAFLTEMKGIPEKKITDWDSKYDIGDEPGDDPRCPYRDEHAIAIAVERILCAYLGKSWTEYERELQ